jgi:hypothetical protein
MASGDGRIDAACRLAVLCGRICSTSGLGAERTKRFLVPDPTACGSPLPPVGIWNLSSHNSVSSPGRTTMVEPAAFAHRYRYSLWSIDCTISDCARAGNYTDSQWETITGTKHAVTTTDDGRRSQSLEFGSLHLIDRAIRGQAEKVSGLFSPNLFGTFHCPQLPLPGVHWRGPDSGRAC